MITVSNLLARKTFAEFKLVSDDSGLQNAVSETGIYDWETSSQILQSFRPGAFVVTTLSTMQSDPEKAIEALETLIDIKVAAIALKTVFIGNFPRNIIEYANEHHVALFVFFETFFDDIIYTTNHLLSTNNNNQQRLEGIYDLLREEDTAKHLRIIESINPFFLEKCLCAVYIPKSNDIKKVLRHCLNTVYSMDDTRNSRSDDPRFIVFGRNCMLVINTDTTDCDSLKRGIQDFLHELTLDSSDFSIGLSNLHSLEDMKSAIEEALQSAYCCLLGGESFVEFNEVGINQILIPNMNNKWIMNYYNSITEILTDYDFKHKASLMETLLVYVECEGDINLTSGRLYQHGNTIRYRLKKIKSLLNIDTSPDYYLQMFTYATLHNLYTLFEGEKIL